MPERLMDIPVKRLDALASIAWEAKRLRQGLGKPLDEAEIFHPLWAALDRLDAVSDGPVWHCRCEESAA